MSSNIGLTTANVTEANHHYIVCYVTYMYMKSPYNKLSGIEPGKNFEHLNELRSIYTEL